jgi:trigger factor
MRDNPQAQAGIRAPLYEEKVVDLILERANVSDKEVSKEKLLEEDELPVGIVAPAAKKKAAAKPKASAKPAVKTTAKTKKPEVEKPAAKPKAAKAKPKA